MTSRFPADPTLTAFDLMARGAHDSARVQLGQILQSEPDQPDALHGLACLARAAGDNGRAIGLAGKALRFASRLPASRQARFHVTLGLALFAEGHVEPARAALHVAVLLQPSDPRALGAYAEALLACGQAESALESLRQAVALAADDSAYIARLGEVAFGLRLWAEAAEAYSKLTVRYPENGAAWANYGAALFELNAHDLARDALISAVGSKCFTTETLNNLGLVEMARGDLLAARGALEHARTLAPEDVRVGANLGTVFAELGMDEEAETSFGAVIKAAPESVEAMRARFNLGTMALGRGQFAAGWAGFEARLSLPGAAQPQHPLWDGSAGAGPLLVTVEQGLGDMVQFLRFLPQAAALRPLILRDSALKTLARRLPALDQGRVLPETAVPACEISLLSLPHVLVLSERPNFAPYLRDASSVEPGLVGLCWSGNPGYRFDARRSVPLSCLEPLATLGIRFLSLQRGEAPQWMERPATLNGLTDLVDAVGRCALVISVDTLVAHVAGAVGRPLWLMNRYGGDWRWKDVHWYRDVVQFAPATPALPAQSWPGVVERVVQALRQWRYQAAE